MGKTISVLKPLLVLLLLGGCNNNDNHIEVEPPSSSIEDVITCDDGYFGDVCLDELAYVHVGFYKDYEIYRKVNFVSSDSQEEDVIGSKVDYNESVIHYYYVILEEEEQVAYLKGSNIYHPRQFKYNTSHLEELSKIEGSGIYSYEDACIIYDEIVYKEFSNSENLILYKSDSIDSYVNLGEHSYYFSDSEYIYELTGEIHYYILVFNNQIYELPLCMPLTEDDFTVTYDDLYGLGYPYIRTIKENNLEVYQTRLYSKVDSYGGIELYDEIGSTLSWCIGIRYHLEPTEDRNYYLESDCILNKCIIVNGNVIGYVHELIENGLLTFEELKSLDYPYLLDSNE
ncbi:hypothetical protein RI065_05790 [Mycoplasmatota bacterium zrk1]